uniref:Putative secreted peptide n=1 Tax=Anopheles braziliensis TaxID=58242 RepID=A0A2M3ZMY0_9DIPT
MKKIFVTSGGVSVSVLFLYSCPCVLCLLVLSVLKDFPASRSFEHSSVPQSSLESFEGSPVRCPVRCVYLAVCLCVCVERCVF